MDGFYYSRIDSPVGPLTLVACGRGLVALEFGSGNIRAGWVESAEETAPYARELEEYFSGHRRGFYLPLDIRGTDFQKRCWQ
jgi:O6-methylguanine-DNA--protein-cysteine methyltransferase